MIERITQSMLAATATYTSQKAQNRLANIYGQMSSGKRVQFASEDPASTVDSMRLRKQLAANEQYQRNIDDANSWLSTLDSAMQDIDSKYTEVKASLIGANSGSNSEVSLRAYAADIRQRAAGIMNQANSTYLGRTVFAGNSDKGQVFRLSSDGKSYLQTDTDAVTASPVTRQINSNQKVQANVDGNQLFGTGAVAFNDDGSVKTDNNPNVMNLLNSAADLLEAKGRLLTKSNGADPNTPLTTDDGLTMEQVNQRLNGIQTELSRRQTNLQTEQATLGARHKIVEESQQTIIGEINAVKAQVSTVEDADVQKLTIDFSLADMAYKYSLNATTRVTQPTLLDYLR